MDSAVQMLRLDMLFRLFIGESFVKAKYGDEQAGRVRVQARGSTGVEKAIRPLPSVLQAAANLDDKEEEDDPQVAAKTKVTNYLQFCLDCLQSPA
ncbi:hypothetical protein PsorP6_017691 [Peronosclerospora sorghi]|uniref:Uncharacterized protein n=1 Tax=Peronosclerospora sorghi TaxID=230839 RepID=A0ACC0WLR1_9STRA|nr:hypothetical protein PsorP6_017691 [Peronosclerospora sorghi]